MELETKLNIKDIVRSQNIAEELSDDDLAVIGNAVWEEWQLDAQSRSEWEERTADAMRLALQTMEEKTFPWAGASNVKFPIITIAALQYSARAYPALIPSPDIVKSRVYGADPDGQKALRAQRVEDYMSFQLLEEDACWEEHMDKALISQAIVGCAFKKSYFDTTKQHNVSEHVLAKDLYIPYFAKSLENASRITQILYVSKNDLLERYRQGYYLEAKERSSDPLPSAPLDIVQQETQGVVPAMEDPAASIELLEQHRWLDLDGDGYEEPYIVTVVKETNQVLRIVARFFSKDVKKNTKGEITCIYPQQYFTKFPFVPSPDGGIYDLGFGVLLSPLNESINTILDQLVDAGTLSITAGGFLGRGVKFRSGDNSFKPFEWKRVDSTGDDLRKGVFPLPVRDPSPVLMQLLSLLIDYAERIGMATDPMVGENPGQNTPAETSRNMLAEGGRVFNSVFKRTYRALKEEFRKLYKLNSIYLNDENDYSSRINGKGATAYRADFAGDGKEICPAADPDMVTEQQKMAQAMALKAAAQTTPGYDMYKVEKQYLKSLKIPNIEEIYPDPQGPNALPTPEPQPDVKVIVEGMKLEHDRWKEKNRIQEKMFDLMQEMEYLRADIVNKEASAALMLAQAEGVEAGQQVAALQQAVALAKQKQDGLIQTMNILKDLAQMKNDREITEKEIEQKNDSARVE